MKRVDFKELKGKTLININVSEDKDEITFIDTRGIIYKMYHEQDCCEDVFIDDICGDLSDLIGSPILLAEDVNNFKEPPMKYEPESYTWTFYKIATIKGTVVLKWFGESNGYYSENVDFVIAGKRF